MNGVRVCTNSAVVEAPHLEIAKSEVLIKSNIVLLFVIVVKTMKNCAAGSGVLPSGAVAERMCNFSAVFQDIKNKTRLFVSFYGNDKKKVY